MNIVIQFLLVCIYMFSVFCTGFWLYMHIARPDENKLLIVVMSFFTGLFTFLSVLALLLNVMPLAIANIVLLTICVSVSISVLHEARKIFRQAFLEFEIKVRHKIYIIIFFLTLISVGINFGTPTYDAFFHETLSTSMLNGNFPLKTPWYSDCYLAYHYGFDLLAASTQSFCFIDQLDVHRPWYFIFPVLIFLYLFTLFYSYFYRNYKLAVLCGIAFLFFSLTGLYDLVHFIGRILTGIETTSEIVSYFRRDLGYSLTNYISVSRHVLAFIKYPVFFTVVHILLFKKQDRNPFVFICVSSLLLSFLCLCDEPIFLLTIVSIGLLLLLRTHILKFYDNKTEILMFLLVLSLTGLIVLAQGGLIPTKLFHGDQLLPKNSEIAAIGGYSTLLLKNPSQLFQTFWSLPFLLYKLPVIVGVLIVTYWLVKTKQFRSDLFSWSFVLIAVFISGLAVVSAFTLADDPKNIQRAFNLELGTVFLPLLLIIAAQKYRKFEKIFTKNNMFLFVVILTCFPSTLWISSRSLLSVRYYYSNTSDRDFMNRSVEFGNWQRKNLPKNSIMMGVSAEFDPELYERNPSEYQSNPADLRFSGLYSRGGNLAVDHRWMVNLSDYLNARKFVNYEYAVTNGVTHLILQHPLDSTNAALLSDTSKFKEVLSPFSDFRRVFRIIDFSR
ncbi:hypothetical protein F9K33_13390 [bacterium]|nr:MAG: hypothetical protein F9K33_13390 [bacterium]